MSKLNIGNIKLNKNNIISSIDSTKNSNTLRSYENKSRNYELNKSNSECILPVINSSNKEKPLLEPTSILTKFIHDRTSKIIKISREGLINPNRHKKSKILFPSKMRRYNNEYELESGKLLKNNSEIIINKSKLKGVFITEKNKNNLFDNKIKNNKLLSILKNNKNNINKNNSMNEGIVSNIKNENLNNDNEEIFLNEKELNNINIPISNIIPDNTNISNPLTPKFNDSLENKNSLKKIINYTRLIKFDPPKNKIKKNFIKSSLRKNNSESDFLGLFHIYNPDVKFQSNIFNEQFILLNENFKEYKKIINLPNYIDVFKSISLNLKIKYNKSLEEICGILYKIPTIILGKYYNFMLGLIKIDIPNKKKFREKIIYDEVINMVNNNNLLFEVNKYSNKSFEFYLAIIKEEDVKDIYLNQEEFFKLLNYFDKVRYNILYLINSFNNAKNNYIDDLTTINKIIQNDKLFEKNENNDIIYEIKKNNIEKEDKKGNNINVIEKIRNELMFKNDGINARKYRIESAIGLNNEESHKINYMGKILPKKRNKFKSLFNNKCFIKILEHCNKKVRHEIITQKITNEISSLKPSKGYHVLKINF